MAIYFVDTLLMRFTGDKLVSFIMTHLTLLPLMFTSGQNKTRTIKNFVWWSITVLHGIAHIVHPPFINGTTVNPNYTPLYDYIIHASQCLLVWYYHQNLFPVGVFGAIMMVVGAAMAHLNREILETNFWLFASGWGVFGAIYHMMLINHSRSNTVFFMNLVIWTLPYVGYLYPDQIPVWDNFVNNIGLFRLWFGAYYLANHSYNGQ
jgi:hypothetical protein